MGGDNPVFRVAGKGDEFLAEVLELGCRATGHGRNGKHPPIAGYASDADRFVLFRTKAEKATLLPAPMTATQVAPMISAWLASTADYGGQPDHDGDNGKGWLVQTGSWGHVSYHPTGHPTGYPSDEATTAVDEQVLRKAETQATEIANLLGINPSSRPPRDQIATLASRITHVAWEAERARLAPQAYDFGWESFLSIEPYWECYGK